MEEKSSTQCQYDGRLTRLTKKNIVVARKLTHRTCLQECIEYFD